MDTPHGRLVGLPDATLRELAPGATHQHAKGGLYQDLGPAMDDDAKEPMRGADGAPMRAWLHVHPHARQVWIKSEAKTGRFRPLA